jgi:phosphatidylglycerol:prolipoprotein diacylglycerol transferase
MYPILFKSGDFELRTFGLLMVVGFLVAILWVGRRASQRGIPKDQVIDISFWTLLAGILGARIGYILQEWPYYRTRLGEVFSIKFEGLTSFGGFILGGLVVLLWSRKNRMPTVQILDLIALPALAAHAIGRIGCFFNGCCYGVPCPPPLGVHFHGLIGTHHPAQLYDMAMTVVGVLALSRLERRPSWLPGYSIAGFFIVYGVSRFIYEFWRAGSPAEVQAGIASSTYWGSLPITEAQAMAGGFVLLGLAIAMASARRRAIGVPAENLQT